MLRNDNLKNVKRLKRSVRELNLDLKAIGEEHDRYRLQGSNEEAMEWFHCLPIETLAESFERQYHKPRTKYSLQDMKHKFALRKLHEKKSIELERKTIELNIAKIDYILSQIENIENDTGTNSSRSKRGAGTSRQKVGRSKS